MKTTTATLIQIALVRTPNLSVKEIATQIGKSDSVVRETLNKMEGITRYERAGKASAVFTFTPQMEVQEVTELEADMTNQFNRPLEEPTLEEQMAEIKEAGKELAVSVKEALAEADAVLAEEGKVKKARKSLNPQPVIDKKRAILEEAGYWLFYHKDDRLWSVGSELKDKSMRFDSKYLSGKTAQDLVAEIEAVEVGRHI